MDDQEDPAIDCADVRLSCEQAADLTLEDIILGEEDDDGSRQRVLCVFDDHLCGGGKQVIEWGPEPTACGHSTRAKVRGQFAGDRAPPRHGQRV